MELGSTQERRGEDMWRKTVIECRPKPGRKILDRPVATWTDATVFIVPVPPELG